MPSMNSTSVVIRVGGSPDNLSVWSLKNNDHWHEYDGARLTNRTGAGLVAGDVVAVSTVNTTSVVLENTVASHRMFVVCMATIADLSTGECARSGRVTARVVGTPAVGSYLRKSATTKALESTGLLHTTAGRIPDGTLAYAVGVAGGGFQEVVFLPVNAVSDTDIIIASGADQSITGTTETDIFGSVTSVLANTLPADGGLVSHAIAGILSGGATTGSDKTITFRLRYGATTAGAITILARSEPTSAVLVNEPFFLIAELTGHGTTNSQRGYMRYYGRQIDPIGEAATIDVTPAVIRGTAPEDSTTTLTCKVTAQWSHVNGTALIERARSTRPWA